MPVYCDNLDVFEDSVQFRIVMAATKYFRQRGSGGNEAAAIPFRGFKPCPGAHVSCCQLD